MVFLLDDTDIFRTCGLTVEVCAALTDEIDKALRIGLEVGLHVLGSDAAVSLDQVDLDVALLVEAGPHDHHADGAVDMAWTTALAGQSFDRVLVRHGVDLQQALEFAQTIPRDEITVIAHLILFHKRIRAIILPFLLFVNQGETFIGPDLYTLWAADQVDFMVRLV